MNRLPLTLAISHYDHVSELVAGRVLVEVHDHAVGEPPQQARVRGRERGAAGGDLQRDRQHERRGELRL